MKEKILNGTLLIDVRENFEVEQQPYQAPNVLHIPLSEILNRSNEIPKNQEVIVGCRAGARSQKAIDILKPLGFDNLINLEGGIIAFEGE